MSNQFVRSIEKALTEIFESAQVSQVEIESLTNSYPLFLFLTLNLDKIGFAVSDGKPEEDYSRAFEKFRELYALHATDWAAFDLALVLCIMNRDLVTDEFWIEKEHDPYFCRKFVIDLKKDLKSQLSRLPFIPLSPTTIGLKRPLSAQTFLMEHGTKSELAKYLVVPHARGIERIVEECLREDLGKPVWREAEIEKLPSIGYEEIGPKVRLKKLEINNFRAYRGNHTFDLDADLVVLFGPNGFGKTSFFDAIDFLCTGGVARLDDRFGRNVNRLANALRYLDAPMEDSFVKAITGGNEDVTVERRLSERTQAYVKGATKNRTRTLMTLSGLSDKLMDVRAENFVRLFRATHFFGQEFRSLTSELQDYSTLPEDIVSRMLAFQDYVEAINKAGRVSEELKRELEKKKSDINLLENSLGSIESEMDQLRRTAEAVEKPEAVLLLGKRIAEKIRREKNLSIKVPKEFDQKVVRGWRAQIEARRNTVTKNLEIIEKLKEKLPELSLSRRELEGKVAESIRKKESILQLNKIYSEKKQELGRAEEEFKQKIAEERGFSLRRENLSWLLKARAEYEQLRGKIAEENNNQRDIQKNLVELLPKIEKLRSEKDATDKGITELTSGIETLERNLNEVTNFGVSLPEWLREVSHQEELELQLSKVEQQLVKVRKSLQIKQNELGDAIDIQDSWKSHLDELQQSQSELKTLLTNIEKHITDEVCPVCGTLHESRDILMKKLNLQRGMQPKQLREGLRTHKAAKARVDALKKQVRDLETKVNKSHREIARIKQELDTIRKKIKIFEDRAISLEIPITAKDLVVVIDSRKRSLLKQIRAKQQELSDQKSQVQKQHEELVPLLKQKANLEQKLRMVEFKQSQFKSRIGEIRTEASTRQVSLELKKEGIQRDLKKVGRILGGLRGQINKKQSEFQSLQKECSNLSKEINIQRKQLQELDDQASETKKFVKQIEALITKLNLGLDLKLSQLVSCKESIKEELARLDALQTEVTNLEVALDAAQMSAALSKAQRDRDKTKKQVRDCGKEKSQLDSWLSYFHNLQKELQSVRNRALEDYTTKYGPLASNIQKRLRAVYGFGEIHLRHEKGGIMVEVERAGEKGFSPSDYFSASQMNIVALSLFMSAAFTQTWSSFAPVLLDDPVTHFDDLNAYSLIDLFRGLLMRDQPGKGRQFIISTCEDRLFRLMREKFSRLNGRAIYYVFESIGEKGPKVRRI